ncbi:MAG: hypothetical protein K1V95_07970 [Eubacterium sp.]
MTDTGLVKKSVAVMGGFDEKELEKYSTFISAAVLQTQELIAENADENDVRIIQYAAALAYKAICCTAEMADGIASFTAGDVSLKQETDARGTAESALAFAREACRGFLKPEADAENSSFAFLGV